MINLFIGNTYPIFFTYNLIYDVHELHWIRRELRIFMQLANKTTNEKHKK